MEAFDLEHGVRTHVWRVRCEWDPKQPLILQKTTLQELIWYSRTRVFFEISEENTADEQCAVYRVLLASVTASKMGRRR